MGNAGVIDTMSDVSYRPPTSGLRPRVSKFQGNVTRTPNNVIQTFHLVVRVSKEAGNVVVSIIYNIKT